MRRAVQLFLPALLLAFLIPSALQGAGKRLPASAYKLIEVKVSGTKRYTPADFMAATGLKIGQFVKEDDFKRATQILGDSGAFTDVGYGFQYSSEGTKVEFQVKDNPQFVPVKFDNLVWFSDQELLKSLHASIPLFNGELPLGGNMADHVNEALQGLIAGKNIPAEVDYLRSGPANGPITAFLFSVSGPRIEIRNVEFPGAGPEELAELEASGKLLRGQDYLRSALQAQVNLEFLPVYLKRGYLKASFSEPEATVVQNTGQQTTVDVKFPVTPNLQYKVTADRWTGNAAFSSDSLQSLVHLVPGKPVNAVQLNDDLGKIKRLYGTKGFMAAQITPVPAMDEAHATVTYEIRVDEGPVYKMGDLTISGVDSRTMDRLNLAWKLRPGQTYNSSYAGKFLDETTSLLPEGHWKTTVHESPNRDHTVDVTLRYEQKGPELP